MSTPPAAPHEPWEELAAGHALHALEPDEEATFVTHLATCERCRLILDDHELVAAHLGGLADDSDLQPPGWERIRAVLPQHPAPTAGVVALDRERVRRRPPRLLGAAAGAVLLAGAAVAAWQLSTGGSGQPTGTAAISQCQRSTSCHVVRLPEGDAKALVLAGPNGARFLPTGLAAAGRGHVYALWQLPRDGRPVLVAVLPAVHDGVAGPSTRLALPYADTAAFAISLEPANVVPSKPTRVVAVGTAPA